jgi:hypothetical protein
VGDIDEALARIDSALAEPFPLPDITHVFDLLDGAGFDPSHLSWARWTPPETTPADLPPTGGGRIRGPLDALDAAGLRLQFYEQQFYDTQPTWSGTTWIPFGTSTGDYWWFGGC